MIHADKCAELNLPTPKTYETQLLYILRLISEGFVLNTRICRFIGIHNLHSLASVLVKRGVNFTLCYERVYCPFIGDIPPYPVDVIYMTKEQQEQYRNEKAAMA
ncbi:MAG: hypothetical protein IPK77_09760 [Cellvibrio sp.]|nr:hypothetical protein [Cellvibrio sp.]